MLFLSVIKKSEKRVESTLKWYLLSDLKSSAISIVWFITQLCILGMSLYLSVIFPGGGNEYEADLEGIWVVLRVSSTKLDMNKALLSAC